MQCPDCGYVMTAFDKDCPRCEKMAGRLKPCLKCGNASAAASVLCQRCGHRFGDPVEKPRPSASPDSPKAAASFTSIGIPFAPAPGLPPTTAPASLPDTAAPANPSVLPADYLCCRVCGNASVQKVSAICQAGSWSGQTQGQSLGATYGPNGAMPVSSITTSSVSGATTLAQMLMPPKRPSYAASGCAFALGAIMAACGLLFAILCMTPGGSAVALIVWLLISGGGVAIYLTAKSDEWKQKKRVAERTPHWEYAMAAWNRLFYCPRCAHVFDPAAGSFASANQMHQLLINNG